MRRRFFITLLSLCSLLTAPALLAQSSRTTREKATPRGTRRRAEGTRAAEPTVKKATTKPKRETAAASDRPKTTTHKRSAVKAAETAPAKPKRSGTSTTPAGRVEVKPTAKTEVKKPTDTKPTANKVEPGTPKAAVAPVPGAKPKPATRSGANPLAAADQAYFKKSYVTALKQYQEAVRQRLVPQERRPLIDYRIARSLGFTEQWDASINESVRVANRYPNTIWDARSKSWLMRMYLKAPHAGWKVGERYVRGKDAPETDATAQPQQVDLTPEDLRKAVLYGEQSKSLYEKLREETKGTGEETDLTADLARLIAGTQWRPWVDGRRWKPPTDDAWKLDPTASYDPTWAPPKKILQLYLSAEEMGTKAQKPLVRLAQADWLHGYHEFMTAAPVARKPRLTEDTMERKPIPYPYQDRSAPEVLRTLARDYPEHSLGDYALYTAGEWLNEAGKYAEALEAYAALSKARPDTQWALAAKSAAAAITRASLQVKAPKPQAPGKKAGLELTARNVSTLKCAAYSVKLEDVVKDGRVLSRPRAGISELLARIGKTAGLKKFYQGDPITWEQTLTPKSEYDWINTSIDTPLTKNGAYAVEIEGGPVRNTVVLIISDLAAMQLVDQDRATTMVVNAETGAPVADAQVLIREVYTDADKKQQVSAATVASNAEGLVEKPLAPKRMVSDDVLSFAWKGDRYAFTEGAKRHRGSDVAETTAYIYTDRPIYRPGQRVNFRALLASRDEQGNWKPLAEQKAKVEVVDGANTRIDSREVSTSGYGTASGSFVLGARPALGRYNVSVTWGEKDGPGRGNSMFRVEEYKKPEFSVTVFPGDGVARVGEPLKVRISARYYFGAAVANAKVKYRALRSEWIAPSPFPDQRPAHGLGGLLFGIDRSYSNEFDPRSEPLPFVPPIEGTATTDANGDAIITLDTKIAEPRFQGRHLTFDITAEVTDASRRTLEGYGEVRALATQFNAFVQTTRGFVSAGEPLAAEVRTLDAAGRPVAVNGTGRVFRVFAEGDKTRTEEVFSGPARTDATGQGLFTWTQSRPGRYEVRFEAWDAGEKQVTGSTEAWVAGDSAGEGVSAEVQVRLIPELRSYRAGQKARVLLVSDQPNATVLLTQQAGSRILEQRVLRLDGRSSVLEVALNSAAAPSLVVTASGIRKRRFFHSQATVKVPTTEQLLTVDVTPDKSVYKPGEQAMLRVRTRDAAGQPVSADVSAGVIDNSLLAIADAEREPIGETLYGYRYSFSFRPEESLTPVFASAEEDQQPAIKRSRPPATSFEGLGNIESEFFPDPPGHFRLIAEEAPPEFADAMAEPPSPAIRKNFADTAFWTPSVVTDAKGEATVSFTWPDNLTQWQVLARGWSESGQVGESRAQVTTAKDLLVRLQAPRFFVERDELVLSANVHNYTPTTQKVKVTLQLEGQTLVPAGSAAPGPPSPRALNVPRADRPGGAITFGEESASGDALVQWIDVPSGSEQRVDWRVRVDRPGEAKIRVLAEAEADSDAVELTFPVLAHGVEKRVQKSGAMLMGAGEKPGTRSEKVTVTVPTERAPDAGELVVTVSPSSGMVMLDALPYLAGYPYGCTEQTLSRFMPSVVSAKVLQDLGLDLDDLRKRIQKGEGPAARGRNPLFQAATLKNMTTEGLERLRRFQLANGGWGWWENDTSDDRITAYVVQGLLAGKEAGVAVPASMLDHGLAYLEGRFAKETDLHDRVNQGWVLSLDRKRAPAAANALLESVYPKRDHLTAYGLALLALTLKNGGHATEARVCMENLENTARIDKESGTCSWTRNLGTWWAWYNQDVETTAACLRVFNALEPKHRLAPMIVRWLANNRVGNSWSSTRDTALVVYALAEYVKGQRELAPDYTLTVEVGGRQKKTFRVNAENALTFDNRLVVPAASLGSGAQEITVTREGGGNVYFTAALRYFTLEEGVKAAGNEIRVRRRYYRLTKPEADSKDELTKDGYRRTAVNAGDRLTSGDLLEVELLVESKNAYEQLVFEDMKPSGCEPVELRSGTRYGDGLCSNLELRDDRVAFFVTHLPQGKRLLSYRMRAETPGTFHALPLTGYAMYAPAIRCISDEGNFSVEDTTSVKH